MTLDEVTIKDAYPLPRMYDIMETLVKEKNFYVVDATSVYHQIALDESSKEKTVFSWRGEHFEFTGMPFGLCNAHSTFQSILNTVLKEENLKFVIPYLDNVIIFSNSLEKHKANLSIVLGKKRRLVYS